MYQRVWDSLSEKKLVTVMLYRLEELYLCRDKPECCYRGPRLLRALILICIMVSASYASTIWKWGTQVKLDCKQPIHNLLQLGFWVATKFSIYYKVLKRHEFIYLVRYGKSWPKLCIRCCDLSEDLHWCLHIIRQWYIVYFCRGDSGLPLYLHFLNNEIMHIPLCISVWYTSWSSLFQRWVL